MSPLQNWHKWLVLPLLGLALSARTIGCDYSSITEKFGAEAVTSCNEKCPFQNRTGDSHFDLTCGTDCSIQQCTLGCGLWREALENTCQTSCNVTSETVLSRELYCVMGCNEALNTYFQKLRELIGTPPAPALVADSLTPTSLSLVWEAPSLAHPNLSCLLQWRYEELPGAWQYYSNRSHADRSIISVRGLHPYTKYRFRVAIFLSGRANSDPIFSAPSVVIPTVKQGPPSSEPTALRLVAPDPTRIAVSWQPGPFTNGPLIGYVLRLNDSMPNGYAALKDMPASNNTLFYMFQNVAPARSYQVSVAMRNEAGEGPPARLTISTPPLPASVPQQPILILGGEHNILASPANDILSDPVELYSTDYKITGVGLDISSDCLFVSVSNGYVYRSSLSKKSAPIPILTPETISYKPLDLSVDWLNQHLYVLGEVFYNKVSSNSESTVFSNWEILRCDFDGKNQLVALSGFTSRPIHFEVDPYNGYLFWAARGAERGGLYRLPLAAVANGARRDAPPQLLVRDAHLGAFTVDHAHFRLLLAHLRRNNVLALSLDGREVTDFRSNTQKPMFLSTRSIAYANGLFYWTDGNEMLTEEYHEKSDSYFHNEYPLVFNMKRIATRQVLVNLRSCQPIPVPVNPPIEVQSVMGIDIAKVSWSPPHLLGHQGSGAWQQWQFHLQLTHLPTGETIDIKEINGYNYLVQNLKQDAEYAVKVAAVTESGSGPWSSEFIGKTLDSSPATLQSSLLWAGPDGLLKTDLTGDNLKTLIPRAYLKNLDINGISWYRDKLYLVTNASTVLWYNTTTHEKGLMPNMENVGCLAVDWLGKRLYWSNPKQQLITRGNLDGSSREPVPIVTVAKELTIDSLAAYIYWNTGHAVEAARLNGENKMVYYPAQLFSGKQVMGLTADLEEKWLYWLVRSYDGSELHRAPTADILALRGSYEVAGTLVSRLRGTAARGPLVLAARRLAWLRGDRAVLADLAARYVAEFMLRVHHLALWNPTQHLHTESLIAIPDTIDASSIKISGNWERFNVTWAPATNVNVNNSRVYYDVSLHFPTQTIERTVETTWVPVEGVGPHSTGSATVRAATPWGAGRAARASLVSPPAPPAAPTRPRLYLHTDSGGEPRAVFRWRAPRPANGELRGYETQCWVRREGRPPAACSPAPPTVPPARTQLTLPPLPPAATYLLQVRAYTDAGFGPYSDIVSISSDDINPIPRVMISSQESIKIIDLDSGDSETIPKSTGLPVDLAVSMEENIVYWVNNLEEIFSSRINGSGHYKLTSINGSASSLCYDWVGRGVFWAQRAGVEHAAYGAALPPPGAPLRPTRLLASRRKPLSMQCVPALRSLYWYEEDSSLGLGTIMTSKMDGTDVRTFFNNSQEQRTQHSCNCSENPQSACSFVIDMTKKDYELYWIDPWLNQIMASDMQGCMCRVVVDAIENKQFGFIPMSITVDSKYIYWFNSTENQIYYTTKNKKSKIEQNKVSHGYKILALDPANQPYPPRQCLFPRSKLSEPTVISNSANSITLRLPKIEKPKSCSEIEYPMPAAEYTVLYRPHSVNTLTPCDKESCSFITSTDEEVMITDLHSFTNYSVTVQATNYYAKLHEVKPVVGSEMILQTEAEAPRAARGVLATVLSPELARVAWSGERGLWYELHWRTDDSPHDVKEHKTVKVSEGREANMTRLTPGTLYTVWVRARSHHSGAVADSAELRVRTYPLPPPLTLTARSAYSLSLAWAPPAAYRLHKATVEYSEVSTPPGEWQPCSLIGADWVASDLRPRVRYRFRLCLQYSPQAPPYYWPHDDRFTYETKGDVPGPPGPVTVEAVGARVLRARWAEPDPRGAAPHLYRLWGRAHRVEQGENATKNISEMWPTGLPEDIDDDLKTRILRDGLELLYNGTDNYWLIGEGTLPGRYTVWAQARNEYGWGPLSAGAALAERAGRARGPAALVAAAAAVAVAALALTAPLLYVYKRGGKKKAEAVNAAVAGAGAARGPDVELATLRQLPTRHAANLIYNQGVTSPSDVDLAALPHIRREQITLNKFLGSGAFGEVFEGVARGLDSTGGQTKVAVKTLRKGATEQEKTEFLQEAALMSNFKHEHILRLLGVCLDNDPHYIIMELMEGGDLLSYLRAKRPSLYTQSAPTLRELVSMMVDVARGCRYLEAMHFVHRDLACRNCLVAPGPACRVKIGDFGLARDIYRNDYYRKEGEGLLPVRWMAPECLVDGVFSCQSDVWAWAVLCGEVLSLGQQPYPGRTNRQVLAYVRAGGTPDRPPHCPDLLYELLLKCWSYSPEARPTFKQCLGVVSALRDRLPAALPVAPAPPHYLTLLPDAIACADAVDNRTYLLDVNDNAFLEEEDADSEMEPSRLVPGRVPKYIELMYAGESVQRCDGYEMPRVATRHSVAVMGAERRVPPALARSRSLRAPATVLPLRASLAKRASLCERLRANDASTCPDSHSPHQFKTTF